MKSKAARGLAAIGNVQERHETCREIKAAMNCRNPKYNKAARGRAALRNISKRRETRRTPKIYVKCMQSITPGLKHKHFITDTLYAIFTWLHCYNNVV